jgi:uncharacterized protein with GYD domain
LSEPSFDELLRRLSAANTEFVVVGGLAVSAWGVVRGTKDVDVVLAPDPENLTRVAEVAVAANGHIQRGDADLRARATEADVLAVAVAVCSLEDLKAMKRAAGRTRDLADLEDLEASGG